MKKVVLTVPEGIKLVIAGSVGTEQAYMQSLLKLAEAKPVVFLFLKFFQISSYTLYR